MKVLVTGSGGQLGQEYMRRNSWMEPHEMVFLDRGTLDITSKEAVAACLSAIRPDLLVNCAAYTGVDKAEMEATRAALVNVNGVSNLAEATKDIDIPLVHFSSDYVYHNGLDRPLSESDPCQPQGVYAITKLKGEQAALRNNERTIIIRTSWVYARHGHNFLNTMLRIGQEKDSLNIVYDQIGAPTACCDLVSMTKEMLDFIDQGGQLEGVYNYSNRGVTSWYDYALEIFRLAKIKCRVSPILSHEYPTPAPRPCYSVLNTNKIEKKLNITIPHWRYSLEETMREN